MIRIDLFRRRANQSGGVDRVAESGGMSAFVSKKETLIGITLFLAAMVVLGTQLADPYGEEPEEYPIAGQVYAPPEEMPPVEPEQTPPPEVPEPEPELQPDPASEADEIEEAPEPAPTTTAALPEPPPGTAVLREIDIDVNDSDVTIRLHAGRALQSSWFTLPDPPRVVIDLKETSLEMQQRFRQIEHPQVQALRFAQFQLEPMIVRLVVEVAARPEVETSMRPDGLEIRITPPEPGQ